MLHIELRRLASLMLIAPLGCNTLSKLSHGMCDNLLTCIVRAWDLRSKKYPMIVAPAMNTVMYEQPNTTTQLEFLTDTLGFKVLPTCHRKLICKDEGLGAMLDVKSIIKVV